MALEAGTCCHVGCPEGKQLVYLAKPLECSWWGQERRSGWWVCSPGVLPPSPHMGLNEFPEGGGTARPGKAQGLFSCPDGPFIKHLLRLSRWHRPLPGLPHLRGSFLSAGKGALSAKKVVGACSSELHPFAAHLAPCDGWPGPCWVACSAVSQDLPRVLGQLWD